MLAQKFESNQQSNKPQNINNLINKINEEKPETVYIKLYGFSKQEIKNIINSLYNALEKNKDIKNIKIGEIIEDNPLILLPIKLTYRGNNPNQGKELRFTLYNKLSPDSIDFSDIPLLDKLPNTVLLLNQLSNQKGKEWFLVYFKSLLLKLEEEDISKLDPNKLDLMLTSFLGRIVKTSLSNYIVSTHDIPAEFLAKYSDDFIPILIKLANSNLSSQEAHNIFDFVLKSALDLYNQDLKDNGNATKWFLSDVKSKVFDKVDTYNVAKYCMVGNTDDGRLNVTPFSPIIHQLISTPTASMHSSFPRRFPVWRPYYPTMGFSLYPAMDAFLQEPQSIFSFLDATSKFKVSNKIQISYNPDIFFFTPRVYPAYDVISDLVSIYNKYKQPLSFTFSEGNVSGSGTTEYVDLGADLRNPENQALLKAGANMLDPNNASMGALVKNIKIIGLNVYDAFLNWYTTNHQSEVLLQGGYGSTSNITDTFDIPNTFQYGQYMYNITPVEKPPINPAVISSSGTNVLPFFRYRQNNGTDVSKFSEELDLGFFVQKDGKWFFVTVDYNSLPEGTIKNAYSEFKTEISKNVTVGGGIQTIGGEHLKDQELKEYNNVLAGYFLLSVDKTTLGVAIDPEKDIKIGAYTTTQNKDGVSIYGVSLSFINEDELKNLRSNPYTKSSELEPLENRRNMPHHPFLDFIYLSEDAWFNAAISPKAVGAGGGNKIVGGKIYIPFNENKPLDHFYTFSYLNTRPVSIKFTLEKKEKNVSGSISLNFLGLTAFYNFNLVYHPFYGYLFKNPNEIISNLNNYKITTLAELNSFFLQLDWLHQSLFPLPFSIRTYSTGLFGTFNNTTIGLFSSDPTSNFAFAVSSNKFGGSFDYDRRTKSYEVSITSESFGVKANKAPGRFFITTNFNLDKNTGIFLGGGKYAGIGDIVTGGLYSDNVSFTVGISEPYSVFSGALSIINNSQERLAFAATWNNISVHKKHLVSVGFDYSYFDQKMFDRIDASLYLTLQNTPGSTNVPGGYFKIRVSF